jgi:hypothetical protein
MAWANAMRNSRLTAPLPAWEWELAWRAELDPAFPVRGLLQTQRRALVVGPRWHLFDLGGERLHAARADGGAALLDPHSDRLYTTDARHRLVAHELEDGAFAFGAHLAGASRFRYDLLVADDGALVVGGAEWRRNPHGTEGPARALVQRIELPEEVATDHRGRWREVPDAPALHLPSARCRVALGGSHVVVATPGHLAFLTRDDLELEALYEGGPFDPLGLASDEHGRAHLLLERDGGVEYWLVLPSGSRALRVDVPPDAARLAVPPAVGYDHTVYVASSARIVAIDRDGGLRWEACPRGPLGGVAVTPDDLLLASEDDRVVAYDLSGARRQLHHFDGDRLVTPPLLTVGDLLLVASRSALYALAPQR